MARAITSLIKETAVYGLSSMVSRFLNWLLTFVYVQVLLPEEFGRMTRLYAWTALLMILLTYGMETAFFRFASRSDRPRQVFATALTALGVSTGQFVLIGLTLSTTIAEWLGVSGSEGLVRMLILIIALDVLCAIPLGYLRYEQRPWRFLAVRLGFVGLTIILTLGVFIGMPYLVELMPEVMGWWTPRDALYYIFGINLVGCAIQLLMLLPTMREAEGRCSVKLLGQMLRYAWPILLLGLVGSFMNQADKILLPMVLDDPREGEIQLGIYGACYKLAVVMVLFTQAFRYAYDPFVFARSREGEDEARAAYADAMRYYTIFTLLILVGVVSMLDLLKYAITPAYYAGLSAVAPVMVGQLMFGIYFNLSLWYKLTDRTHWGAILSVVGAVVNVLIIVLGAPRYGFMACAWAGVASSGLMMLLSYALGQYYYPIRYPLGTMAGYVLLAGGCLALHALISSWGEGDLVSIVAGVGVTLLYLGIALYREVPRALWRRVVRWR